MKKGNVFLGLGLVLCMLSGCGSSSNSFCVQNGDSKMVNDIAPAWTEEATTEEAFSEETSAGSADVSITQAPVESGRKLIKNVNLSVETKNFDEFLSSLQSRVNELGGYMERLECYNGSFYYGDNFNRSADLVARIPVDKLDTFLSDVDETSNVTNRSEFVEDVTLTYVDTKSRADALRTEQERLIELMEKAESVEDIIQIESRLSEVRYELESQESRLRSFDNKIDYSTVSIYISEVHELTPVKENTWNRIAAGFSHSLYSIGNGIKEFAIWFVSSIPYFILIAIVGLILGLVIGKGIKKRKVKKNMENKHE